MVWNKNRTATAVRVNQFAAERGFSREFESYLDSTGLPEDKLITLLSPLPNGNHRYLFTNNYNYLLLSPSRTPITTKHFSRTTAIRD